MSLIHPPSRCRAVLAEPDFAAILWAEGLFRHFDNRRQVAAYAGLAPTPWQSGTIQQEQGISKAGSPRLCATLIQLA
jgi:transposase